MAVTTTQVLRKTTVNRRRKAPRTSADLGCEAEKGTLAVPKSSVHKSWWDRWRQTQYHIARTPRPDELPVDSSSLHSRLTYSWMTPLIHLGNERALEVADLWKVDHPRTADVLSTHLDQALDSQCEQGSNSLSLPIALNAVVGSFFWLGGLCKVFADVCQMGGPVLIKSIINFAKERSRARDNGTQEPPLMKGLLLAGSLLLFTVATSLIHHQFFWRSIVSGTLSRTALISSMYKRSARLSNRSKSKLSNGTLLNFISTDVSRVEACAQWFHPVWAAPIQVSICLVLLSLQLGLPALSGFAVFLLIIPLQKRILGRQFGIRKRLGKLTELRTKSLLEALGSMHLVKCYTLESPILRRIAALRIAELGGVKGIQNIQSANSALAFSLPVLAATLSFVTYSRSGDFDLAVMFASLSLFQLLRQPMTFWPRAVSLTGDALNSLRRLSSVYTSEIRADSAVSIRPHQRFALSVKGASFEWETAATTDSKAAESHTNSKENIQSSAPFRVRDITMDVHRGELVAIVGPVASGKSSLLQGLIGEMPTTRGEVCWGGTVTYCPQAPWIQRATIRDTVIFGKTFNAERYSRVLSAVCLLQDLQELPEGDLSQIGESGHNISGGQRQRIGLARALYADRDILILDDPVSGVDPRVANEIFSKAILNSVKYHKKTIVFVTYTREHLAHCDRVLSLCNGKLSEQNTLDFACLPVDRLSEQTRPPTHAPRHSASALDAANKPKRRGASLSNGCPTERNARASKPGEVYQGYLKAAQGALCIPILLAATIFMQISQVLGSRSLIWWQSNALNRSFGFYQGLYASFGILQAISTFFLGATVDSVSCLVSRNIYNQALRNVLHAPLSFLETTPRGQILSLFGKDIDSIDNQLPTAIRTLCLTIATVAGSVAVIVWIQPCLAIVACFVCAGYFHFHCVHRTTARQIKRIEATLRSNVHAHIAESLDGIQTLRSYDQVDRSIEETNRLLDLQNRASFLSATSQRWLSVRIDFCGAVLVFAVALCAVLGVGGISAPQIGLILTYTTSLTQMAGLLTRQVADVEIQMNSFERLSHYDERKGFVQEDSVEQESVHPPQNWPSDGAITFKGVSLNYRQGDTDVLRGISLNIKPGEKLAIVGRTGAGKSSLVNCLMRIVGYTGAIEIDGVNISTVNLRSLRSKISFVPQKPVVFGGTVRTALDPHGQYADATLREALGRGFICMGANPGKDDNTHLLNLDTPIELEGANLSVGERALLSTTRVLLRDSAIVVLDEATASVDLQTDELVQKAIHREFRDRTVLCISHRLQNVLAYDRILVLDAGIVAELDTPINLFNRQGLFYELCCEGDISKKEIMQATWSTD